MKVKDIQTRHPIPEEAVRSQSDAQHFFFWIILPRLLVHNNRSDCQPSTALLSRSLGDRDRVEWCASGFFKEPYRWRCGEALGLR